MAFSFITVVRSTDDYGIRYAPIAGILMNQNVAAGIRHKSQHWKHGHTYQAHPVSCAAALAVQKTIEKENLLDNVRALGPYMGRLLRQRLVDSSAAAITFDVRGGGFFWAVEFDRSLVDASRLKPETSPFSPLVAEQCMHNNMVSIGVTGVMDNINRDGHCMLAPPFNSTKSDIEKIIDTFVLSVEQAIDKIFQ